MRPLNRSFARANARSPSTEPANPRAIDRDTDLPSCFPHADRDATAGVRRRNTGGGGAAQKTGQGNNMSMLRYYTDDSPGLKITPVRARTPSRNRQPSRGSIHFSSSPPASASPRVVLRSFRETFPAPDRAPSLTERKTKQTGGRADDERVLHRVRHHAPRGVQDLPVHQLVTRRSGVAGDARQSGARRRRVRGGITKKKNTPSRRVR